MLAPEFWSPSPSQSDFIRELRETETAKLPSADTPYPEADPNASNFRSKNPPSARYPVHRITRLIPSKLLSRVGSRFP